MAAPGESPLAPGPHSLFELPAGAVVAADVTALLRAQGQTCNDIGLAVLGAQLGFAHSAETLWRCQDLIDTDDSLGYPIEEYHIACRDHVERLTAVYARAAAQYAVCAVQIASRVADGAPAAVPEPLPVLPSEVLLLAQVHVPLLQIPAHAVTTRWQNRRERENVFLAADHRRLLAAMASVESPPTTFDVPGKVAERQTAFLLEVEFPSALHKYATACAFALAMMCAPDN
jgi:hypothetical protein